MWNFYDELYMGIPSGIRVEGCVVGRLWTTVRANGNIGIARTLGDPGENRESLAQSFLGMHLREAANVLRWDSLIRAAIGAAAMNAFYNVPTLVSSSAPPTFQGELAGKAVSIIGQLPNLEHGLRDCCQLTVLPLPEPGREDSAYREAMEGDVVFLSGDALINGTLPVLLEMAGADTKVSLAGVSVPAAPVLFAYGSGIHNLSGLYARIPATVEGAARMDLENLAPGTAPFSINPKKPRYIHESPQVERYQSSPYRASGFNCAFNPWEGREYDRSAWSPVFKG